jgi:hypothetical protein
LCFYFITIGSEFAVVYFAQNYIYGTGDANGTSYLTSGTLPDWLHYAFGSVAYTVELPPASWDLGNFELHADLILPTCRSAYKVRHGLNKNSMDYAVLAIDCCNPLAICHDVMG